MTTPVVVLGGGRLGAAVARRAAAEGRSVLVASRTPRAHAGLWRRWDAEHPDPLPVVGARVVLAMPPGPNRATLLRNLWSDGAESVVVCAAATHTVDARSPTSILRFGALVGQDDGCVWPMVKSIRDSGTVKLSRGFPRFAPLLLDDAARAALLVPPGVTRAVPGPDAMTIDALADAIVERFGGRYAWRWWAGDLSFTQGWSELDDDWDPDWGPRTSIRAWIGRLPGLRVSRREDRGRSH